jgi:hypothetical protein
LQGSSAVSLLNTDIKRYSSIAEEDVGVKATASSEKVDLVCCGNALDNTICLDTRGPQFAVLLFGLESIQSLERYVYSAMCWFCGVLNVADFWKTLSFHTTAFNSSKYLSELIRQGRLIPTPSEELDRILAMNQSSPTPTIEEKPTEKKQEEGPEEERIDYESHLLIKPHTIKALVETFNLEHQASIELTRARQQTIKSIQQGQMSKLEAAAAEDPASSQ